MPARNAKPIWVDPRTHEMITRLAQADHRTLVGTVAVLAERELALRGSR